MIAPIKPGAALAQLSGPVIEAERLTLRMWREADIAPNTAMLADPASGRFITADGKPITDEFVGWRNAAIMAGHWLLHGVGMFVVEEKSTGKFAGRVGPWFPPKWPDFEIGWGIASEFRGKGYALEAARASIDWAFATFEIEQIIHCIDRENIASQSVARRLGAENQREIDLFGHVADVWVTSRNKWRALPASAN
ncbi:MAG: N-acetyltransferase [Bradyrhizobium sp.]|uniref:GNAT family N-acetyltransferase n=1 Tax=Bradyrhizobium sp. TaxID=376 RepID=UPI0011F9C598|nr:GNAT family N-acetyltransferase [Bradyrhizobium sp.]THD65559.1 MAG: N-acetyltransferase [Bradyrhizobium sp.]